MAMLIGGAVVNALAFTGSNFLFSLINGDAERKRHDLALEGLQKSRDVWNQKRLDNIDYANRRLREQANSEKTFTQISKAAAEYYLVTGQHLTLQDTGPEPMLADYLDENQVSNIQTGEIFVISTGLVLTGYLAYKYL